MGINEAMGGLTQTSKMPCRSFSIPAKFCNVGGKLRGIPGSVCEKCYACKGFYNMGNVRTAMERRLRIFKKDPKRWVDLMVARLRLPDVQETKLFRWFDSGDLQGKEMLQAIIEIARRTPEIIHRMPTKEYGLLKGLTQKDLPDNLIIQVSAPFVDQPFTFGDFPVCGVTRDPKKATCPSEKFGGKCGPCRKCWHRETAGPTYLQH